MTGISSFINRLNIVKQIPVFSKLNWFEIRRVAKCSILDSYKKGELICCEGTPPDFFYCLVSGRIKVYTTANNGKKENVDFIHRGKPFGIISILTGENHSLSFEAINDSIVLKIDKEDFRKFLNDIPRLSIEISHTLSSRIRNKIKGSKSIFESKIISVYSPVEGTGSSTYAVNLALNLKKETKKKVLFIDLKSSQAGIVLEDDGSVATTVQWKVNALDLNELIAHPEKISEKIIVNEQYIDALNVIFDAEDEILKSQIGSFVSAFAGEYHFVIVDLPNNMDEVVLETLTQSDLVHLITSDRKDNLEHIKKVIDGLKLKLEDKFIEEKVRVIIRAYHDKIYLSFEEIDKFISYGVYRMLPRIQSNELSENVNIESFSLACPDSTSEYTKIVKRIAREIGNVLVGLVLGGGAALGVAHVGVIRALEEENIPIDIVVGSSMGALIGSLWVTGRDSHELEAVAREFSKSSNLIKLFDPVIPISGLIGGRLIARWLRKHLGNATFYNSKIPFKVVAYDLVRRQELIISTGTLVDAVRQSIAIPGVIVPMLKKDQIIIDGGVLNPLPTNVLTSLGIKKIIAVNVLQSPENVCEGFDIEQHEIKKKEAVPFLKAPLSYIQFQIGKGFKRLFTPNISDIIIRTLQASEYVIAEQSAQQADVLIHPDLVGIDWFELYRVDDLIRSGEAATRELLPKIKKLIED